MIKDMYVFVSNTQKTPHQIFFEDIEILIDRSNNPMSFNASP